ncbi:MAG: multidrug effflux MFS transporter [Alphaproteobacteria bacterium]
MSTAVPTAKVPFYIPGILIAVGAASIFSTDLYAPSLPHLPGVFDTSPSVVQLTMSVNLAAFALAQLFHGPLADRFGRRPVLLAGMIVFALTAIGAALAWSIGALIFARAFMGMAAAAEAVIALAVIRDLYDDTAAVRILALYNMVIAIAPAVAPVVGGYIHIWLGWRANFIILAAFIAIVTLFIWRLLPETLAQRDYHALRPHRFISAYASLLSSRLFMAYAVSIGCVMGGLFAYITEAPFVLITRHGVPTQHFGLYQAAIVAAFFFGNLLAARLAHRVDSVKLFAAGLVGCVLGAIAMIAVIQFAEAPWTIAAAMAVYVWGLALVFASGPALALAASRGVGGGTAAAMLSTCEVGGGAIGAMAVAWLHDGSAWSMAVTVAGAAIAALLWAAMLLAPSKAR